MIFEMYQFAHFQSRKKEVLKLRMGIGNNNNVCIAPCKHNKQSVSKVHGVSFAKKQDIAMKEPLKERPSWLFAKMIS